MDIDTIVILKSLAIRNFTTLNLDYGFLVFSL